MKTLENIWPKIKFGDIVLYQEIDDKGVYSKPKLVVIVAINVWDMAMAVYYIDYKMFAQYKWLSIDEYRDEKDKGKPQPIPELKIQGFGEWMEYWNILGHWRCFPNFRRLISAYRKQSYQKQGEQTTII